MGWHFKKIPIKTIKAISVKNANIILQLDIDNTKPPSNGANMEIIPLTTINEAKNLANSLPWYLSPTERFGDDDSTATC